MNYILCAHYKPLNITLVWLCIALNLNENTAGVVQCMHDEIQKITEISWGHLQMSQLLTTPLTISSHFQRYCRCTDASPSYLTETPSFYTPRNMQYTKCLVIHFWNFGTSLRRHPHSTWWELAQGLHHALQADVLVWRWSCVASVRRRSRIPTQSPGLTVSRWTLK